MNRWRRRNRYLVSALKTQICKRHVANEERLEPGLTICDSDVALPPGSSAQCASATSNGCPTSLRTHSSKTSIRNRPYCAGYTDRSVTVPPSGTSGGRALARRAVGRHRPFDDRDQQQEPRVELVAEEAVDAGTVVAVRGVDTG